MQILRMKKKKHQTATSQLVSNDQWTVFKRACVRACHMSWNKQKEEERPQCKQGGNYFVGSWSRSAAAPAHRPGCWQGQQSATTPQKIFYLSDLLFQYSLENETVMLRAKGRQVISPDSSSVSIYPLKIQLSFILQKKITFLKPDCACNYFHPLLHNYTGRIKLRWTQ